MNKIYSLIPYTIKIHGVTVSVVHTGSLETAAKEAGVPISKAMVMLLDKNIWPESLLRNHPSLSAAEQSRLIHSRVAVVGCGGLGGYLASFCARMGVGNLLLADGDRYDDTNVNRQCLCTTKTLGIEKAKNTAQHCRDINPWIETRPIAEKITGLNAEEIFDGVDLVLDGLDKVADRLVVYQAACNLGIPFIHGAVMGWSGQTATFFPETGVGLDAVYLGQKDADSPPPVLAPTAALVAAMQCQEALRVLTGKKPKNEGSLIYYDGEEMTIHRMNLLANTKFRLTQTA